MCTVNPQPHELVLDPIKWDRRVPLHLMAVIPFQGKFRVYGPGSAITEEMYGEEFFWPYDKEKELIIKNQFLMPRGKVLMTRSTIGGWEFVYGEQVASVQALKVGIIVDQTDVAIDEALLRLRTTQSR